MGWFSGNADAVNRRTEKRYKEALGLYDDAELFTEQSYDASLDLIERSYGQQMGEVLRGQQRSREAIRERETRALERVSKVTGGNQLSILRTKMGLSDEADIKGVYGDFAAKRVALLGGKMAAELGAETNLLQQLSTNKMGRANLIASRQEQVDEGWGKTLMGAAGSIIGGGLA